MSQEAHLQQESHFNLKKIHVVAPFAVNLPYPFYFFSSEALTSRRMATPIAPSYYESTTEYLYDSDDEYPISPATPRAWWACQGGQHYPLGAEKGYLDNAGAGDCLDVEQTRVHLAALVDGAEAPSPRLLEDLEYDVESRTDRNSFDSDKKPFSSPPLSKNTLQGWLIDIFAGVVAFVTTAVTYISTAHSVVGSFDPSLIYIVVDASLLGTGLAGAWLSRRSRVPWAMASVDVGFAPLLAQLGAVCWNGVVSKNAETL